MRKQIKYKLEDFADVRNFAETPQRKDMIDEQARKYLMRRCDTAKEWGEAYNYYETLIKPKHLNSI